MRAIRYVDVFTDRLLAGNPVAVVFDSDDLTDEQMAGVARWTNLSETTFLSGPTDPSADYRLRIFTPSGELPFAGHPTLGSARAWLDAGGTPRRPDAIVQECGAGLVPVRHDQGRLAFAAPPLRRSGDLTSEELARFAGAVGLSTGEVVAAAWVDNGPGWAALLLRDADAVLAAEPRREALQHLSIGLVGRYPDGEPTDVEVRAFTGLLPALEDPVTGSLNAGIAQWLIGSGRLPDRYTAAQGRRLGRRGRVFLRREGDTIWVGGATVTGVVGELGL